MNLRSYQQDCLDALGQAFIIDEKRRLLIVLATGLGKSCIFSQMPSLFPGEQILVLAHRRKLVQQAADNVRKWNPALHVEIEQAERRAKMTADVIVGSMQTLANPKRREKLLGAERLALVVIDEAHRVGSKGTYRKILEALGVLDDSGPKLLGVTATPHRGGGDSIGWVFTDGVAFEKPILEGIDEGWLSPLSAYAVHTKTNLDSVGVSAGDFKEGELSDTVNTDTRNLEIVRAYQKLASERRTTLVFAVDKAHARSLCQAFKAADIVAEFMVDDIPEPEREATMARFLSGETKVLVNVAILTEGVDMPPVDCVLLGRPTKSVLLTTQMIGRGTRTWCPLGCEQYCNHDSAKRDCLIIDMVDASSRHTLATSATILGLPPTVNAKGKDLRKMKKALGAFQEEFPGFDLETPTEITEEWLEAKRKEMRALMARSRTEVHATAITLFGKQDPSIQRISGLTWFKTLDGSLRLRIPPKFTGERPMWAEVRPDASDHWHIHLPTAKRGPFDSRDEALREADSWVRADYGDRLTLINTNAKWRKDPATPAQINAIKRLGGVASSTMTKGEAGRAIDQLAAMKDHEPCTAPQAWRLRRMGINPAGLSKHRASAIIAKQQRA